MEIARRYAKSTLWRMKQSYGWAWSRTTNYHDMPTTPVFWYRSLVACQRHYLEDQKMLKDLRG